MKNFTFPTIGRIMLSWFLLHACVISEAQQVQYWKYKMCKDFQQTGADVDCDVTDVYFRLEHAHERGAITIGTAGIFGFGNEDIEIKDISEYDNSNPAIEELRAQGITKNHLILTTHKLIRDNEPVTPYTLDEVAKIITMTALKELRDKND